MSLTIPPRMYGLLGPNGAGKSTLMRMIATLQEPDRGSIRLNDIDVLKEKDEVPKTSRAVGSGRTPFCPGPGTQYDPINVSTVEERTMSGLLLPAGEQALKLASRSAIKIVQSKAALHLAACVGRKCLVHPVATLFASPVAGPLAMAGLLIGSSLLVKKLAKS